MSSPPDIPDYPPPSPTSAPPSPHGSTIGTEVGQDTLAQQPVTPSKNKEETKRAILEAAQGTPIREKVSTLGLHHKSRWYQAKVQKEMEPLYREEEYNEVMSSHVTVAAYDTTPTLSQGQLANASRQANFAALRGATEESEMYEPIRSVLAAGVDAARAAHPDAKLEDYEIKDTSNWQESSWIDMKPDLAMYPATEEARLAYSRGMKAYAATKPNAARVAWAWMTMPVEVKYDPDRSAFYFEEGQGLLRDSDLGRESQAQIANYVTQLMIRQHRTFVFLLYICQTKARITRWDRAGCIVSKPFDFVKEPAKLLNFIYRLALMSRSELGYDTTAVLATEQEVKQLTEMVHVNEYARECAEEILNPATRILHPIYKVTCKNVNDKGERSYFIGKHSTASYSVTGRCTKGYVMFILDEKTPCLGFMKDYWRTDLLRIPKELDIYLLLKAKGVEHVATAIGGGDVDRGTQRSVTDRRVEGSKTIEGRLVHCRVALLELARLLDTYADSGELITIVYHALQAHKQAWEEAKVLHRDVSVNNIMLVVDQSREKTVHPRGILIDWDLCKYRSELDSQPTQDTRSGTWPFMSALSLQYPKKPNSLADDLESFIHVITYCCHRFHVHSMSRADISSTPDKQLIGAHQANEELSKYIDMHYNEHVKKTPEAPLRGGRNKLNLARSGQPDWNFRRESVSPALHHLVRRLFVLLKKHYDQIDLAAYATRYSDSSDDDPWGSPDDDLDDKDSAPAPSAHHDSENLNSHDPMMLIFARAANEAANWDGPPDKTKDQFLGLVEWVALRAKGASGSHHSSGLGKRSSEGMAGSRSKRFRLDDTSLHTVQEGNDEHRSDEGDAEIQS